MFRISLLIGFIALSISFIAAYYSIAGLAAIFAGAAIPIIIMGAVLEAGKVAAAAWLHYHWDRAPFLIKAYLVPGVIILMLITSMGIFGFLSKAHVEQAAAVGENAAQIEQLAGEIERRNLIIQQAEVRIENLQTGDVNNTASLQAQIDKEQQRIDSVYDRIQPSIDEQQTIIGNQTKIYDDQIATIDDELATLKRYIDNDEVKKAQRLIGETSPGGWGPKTAATAEAWRQERRTKRIELVQQLKAASQDNPEIEAARKEIARLRAEAEAQIDQSNTLIARLRAELKGDVNAIDTDALVDEQLARIKEAQSFIETATIQRFELESLYRELEAEVGPVKYLAELIYKEDTNNDLLEDAVRWVIIVLVLVFDPLAVILILAAVTSYRWEEEDKRKAELGYDPAEVENEEIVRLTALLEDANNARLAAERKMQSLENKRSINDDELKALEQVAEDLAKTEKLRDELQEALDSANEKLTAQETMIEGYEIEIRRLAAQVEQKEVVEVSTTAEVEQLIQERNDLQKELAETYADIESIQNEIARIPLLEQRLNTERQQVETLTAEISKLKESPINIDKPEAAANVTSLRHKVKILENKIASMIQLSDFDIESAQELIDLRQRYVELENRFAKIVSEYNRLKSSK